MARSGTSRSPYISKARALWRSLHALGAIHDPSDRALTAFARRQLKIDALGWISSDIAGRLIEPLRDMCRRVGYSVPSGVKSDEATRLLITTQLSRLYPDGVPGDVCEWVATTPAYTVIQALGQRIRRKQ